MIVLENLTKSYATPSGRKFVARNINVTFPSGIAIGLLGRNGAGKSTLLRMVAGTVAPNAGRILTDGNISYPVGLASAMHPDMTGAQNTRFVARVYGVDTNELMDFVEDFAELGDHFHMPVRSYSSGMRGRLSFGINMGLDFDTYLIDEVTAAGDANFRKKATDLFQARIGQAGALFVSHSVGHLRETCQAGAVLHKGTLTYYDDVEDAIAFYNASLED